MAHFAKLNENNIVTEVIVVDNKDLLDESGQESEQKGIEFCQMLHGPNTTWKQTSYNGNSRGIFAGIGFLYDTEKDIFVDVELNKMIEQYKQNNPGRRLFDHI